MKGFIFSTEAVAFLIITMIAIGTFAMLAGGTEQSNSIPLLKARAAEQNTLYFNTPQNNQDSTATQQHCATITDLNAHTRSFFNKNYCGWSR